ncbi:hypothetical protein AUJ94_00180 [bacterium CG2_30_40_12]|nr:MAG: hypothetical protein AUJ94_00180 [bacterium CG2_30_40_12]
MFAVLIRHLPEVSFFSPKEGKVDEKIRRKPSVAATMDAAPRHRSFRGSYETAAGIFAGIRERLENTPFAGTLAKEPESLIAVEWGYAMKHAETAARYAFQNLMEDAAVYAWLAVEAANRAEAYFNLRWAEHRLRDFLIPNTRLADNMFATARRLVEALGNAMPLGLEVLGVLVEELEKVDGWPEDLARICEDLCAKAYVLHLAIADSGSGGESKTKPLTVLKDVAAFKTEEVYGAVGEAFRCVRALAYLGGFVSQHIQGAARFCRKNGVDWEGLLDMAGALQDKRVFALKSVEDKGTPSRKDGGDAFAVMGTLRSYRGGSLLIGEAAQVEEAPLADKPRSRRNASKNGGKGGARWYGGDDGDYTQKKRRQQRKYASE